MNKQIKEQTRQILERYENSRNSDALLIINVYEDFYHLPNPCDTLKLLEIMQYCSPDEIVRYRRRFNQDGRYLATSEEVLKKRKSKIPEMKEQLGYNTQKSAIINSILDNKFNLTN